MWFMLLNQIPHEFKLIKLEKGEHLKPEYKEINPMQQVPSLSISSSTSYSDQKVTVNLFESQAILIHLIHKYRRQYKIADSWYPNPHSELMVHTKINQYLNYHLASLRMGIAGWAWEAAIGPNAFGTERSERKIESFKKKGMKVLKQLDTYWLKKQDEKCGDYLCGQEKMSIADLLLYSELMQLLLIVESATLWESDLLKAFPNVAKWAQIMSQTPHHDKIFQILFLLKAKTSSKPSKL